MKSIYEIKFLEAPPCNLMYLEGKGNPIVQLDSPRRPPSRPLLLKEDKPDGFKFKHPCQNVTEC